MNNIFLKCAITVMAIYSSSCGNPLDVLGPRDKPKIVSEQWNQIEVTYWVFLSDNPKLGTSRTFTITDPSLIDRLKSELRVQKTEGLSIGSGNQLVFKGSNGDIWHGDFVFEDTLYMALSSDGWRSYKFTLEDTGFYNDLRSICASNERKLHPKATPDHIKLRSNLAFDYPKL